MPADIEERLRDLARRAGLAGVPPRVAFVALGLLAAAAVLAVWRWWPQSGQSGDIVTAGAAVSVEATHAAESSGSSDASASAAIWVHVVGAVRHPGLYEVPSDSRVQVAVDAAGGLVGDAAPEALNLARKMADGEQIVVPTHDEVERGAVAPASAGGGGPSGVGNAAGGATPIDLNTATAAQLDELPGIGPATAAKIVADREANGAYAAVDDLGRVAGIGPKKLEQLSGYVVVR